MEGGNVPYLKILSQNFPEDWGKTQKVVRTGVSDKDKNWVPFNVSHSLTQSVSGKSHSAAGITWWRWEIRFCSELGICKTLFTKSLSAHRGHHFPET